jgi:hypothetical protein
MGRLGRKEQPWILSISFTLMARSMHTTSSSTKKVSNPLDLLHQLLPSALPSPGKRMSRDSHTTSAAPRWLDKAHTAPHALWTYSVIVRVRSQETCTELAITRSLAPGTPDLLVLPSVAQTSTTQHPPLKGSCRKITKLGKTGWPP